MNTLKSGIFVFASLIFFPKTLSAQEPKLPLHQVYFQHDNDIFRLVHQTDQYYSFGILNGYSQVLSPNQGLGKTLFFLLKKDQEKKLFTADFSLKGYTPEFSKDTLIGNKRPFAGVSVIELGLQSSNVQRMLSLGISLGMRGPASGAEWVQDNFHRLIQAEVFEGWESQLENKFLYGVKAIYARTFKLKTWTDLTSITQASLGNYQTHLDQRLRLRIGKIRPLSQSLMFRNHLNESLKSPEIYLSATLFGRVVGVDTTFGKTDNEKSNPDSINKSNLLTGYEVALNFQIFRFGTFVAHNRISSESNFSTKHSYGSLGVSYSF